MSKPHVVIIGLGFGGTYTAQALLSSVVAGDIDLTVINTNNYFLFTPLLHEVATGGLSQHSVTESIREIFAGYPIRFIQGTVSKVDTTTKQVYIENMCTVTYDYVVISTGATTNFYNIPGAEEHSFVLKNLKDAVAIRENIIDTLEDASVIQDDNMRKKKLSFVVVGGGATGVEMISEIAEFIEEIKSTYAHQRTYIRPGDISVHMVNVGQELLMQFNAPLRAKSRKRLEELGIVMHMGVAVSTVEKERLVLADGSDIPYGFLLWTAGVAPVAPEVVTSSGSLRPRLPTTTSLELKDTPGVFVLGDVSLVETPDGKGYPMVAQVATRQALVVARNIKHHIQGKPLVSFSYQSQGSLVSLGQWYAVGVIFGISISGRIAWFIWRTVYVTKFHSWSKRIKILSEWTQNIFWSRDITKLN